MTWKPEDFEVAYWGGPHTVAGYTYRGLGLHIGIHPSPKGKRPARWILSHLGTGHRIAMIDGDVATAFPIASEIAEAGDWDFLSMLGYKDRFPDAPERLREICSKHPQQVIFAATVARDGVDPRSHAVAQQIAANRL
ncbi:hypothetical protein [Novosphingobium sp.]|uniref:hypothetical protein n=1 Tax=Novosphingobium sp. TaxID=1874826 RepID=UPI00286E9DAE|nr:hypothetical protein [Novosphingobium sp.]